ncbi:MAG: PQQ-binding-like beta-propeller repeat protein [Succinivibrio sp.]
MSRKALVLWMLCGAALLSACSSNKDLAKPVEAPEVANAIEADEAWTASLGGSEGFFSRLAPAVAGQTAYAAGRGGDVYSISLANGDKNWHTDLGDEEENDSKRSARLSGVAVQGSLLAVGSENGWVYLLNAADGKIRWKKFNGTEIMAAPAFAPDGSRLFVADSRGLVTCYDTANGASLWQSGDSSGSLRLRSQSSPVPVGQDALLLGTSSGKVLVLSQRDGGLLDSVTVAQPSGANDLERVSDVAGTPLLLGSELYTSAYNAGFVWYSFKDHAVLNRLGYHSSHDIGFDDSVFVITGDNGHVYCISRQDGHEIWENGQLTNRNVTAPAVYGNYAVVADMEGYVYFLSLRSGRIDYMGDTDDSPVYATPVVTDQGVLVQTSGGKLALFRYGQAAASAKLAAARNELAAAGSGAGFGRSYGGLGSGGVTEEQLMARRRQAQALVSQMEAQERANEARVAEYKRQKAEYERQRAEYLKAQAEAEKQRRNEIAGFGLMPGVKSEGSGAESGKVETVEQEDKAAGGSQGAADAGQDSDKAKDQEDTGSKASGFGIY